MGERVAVALSGGADSCALLLALAEVFPEKLAGAIHFHHGMRGLGADADAGFCAALCARLGVPCLIGLGALGSGASEGAARDARYDFLIDGARELGAELVATAHTADDVAETVLLRVLRGTSVDGLAGIPARRALSTSPTPPAPESATPSASEGVSEERLHTFSPSPSLAEGESALKRKGVPEETLREGAVIGVVRPFLLVRRAETEALCVARGVAFRTDPTNADLSFPRNRLRATLPALAKSFNPRLVEALGRLATLAEADASLLGELSDDLERAAKTDASWSVAKLVAAPASLRRRVLLRALREASSHAVEERATAGRVFTLEGLLAGGGQIDLPGGVRARVARGSLTFSTSSVPFAPYSVALNVPGETEFPGGRAVSTLGAYSRSYAPGALSVELADGTMRAETPLVLRPARPGEKLAPLGMGGRRRLARDLMAEAGWTLAERERRPVLVLGDELLWIPGVRVAESLRLPPETERVARVEIRWEESR